MSETSLALEGVRVLDLSFAIAGPYCGQLLGDLGADVIKIEHPGRALSERVTLNPPGWSGPPFSPYFLSANRNKRSVTLDLKRDEAKEVLADLVRISDVVLESFGSRARTHLVDEHWGWAINPRLIWGSVSYGGRTGPDSEADGYDLLAQARTGLMSITGFPDGPPTKTGNSLGDYLAGVHLAVGVIAALHHREVIGKGQLVDISLLEPMLACLDGLPMWNSIANLMPHRAGNKHLVGQVAYSSYACRDGYIVIATGSGDRLASLVKQVLKQPELLPLPESHDPAFHHGVELINAAVATWAEARSTAEASALLSAARVPNEPVRDMGEIWADSQLESRGALLEYEYEELGAIKTVGSPMHLSESPETFRRVPPGPGAHNDEVLGSFSVTTQIDWPDWSSKACFGIGLEPDPAEPDPAEVDLAGGAGLEPATSGSKVRCSAD